MFDSPSGCVACSRLVVSWVWALRSGSSKPSGWTAALAGMWILGCCCESDWRCDHRLLGLDRRGWLEIWRLVQVLDVRVVGRSEQDSEGDVGIGRSDRAVVAARTMGLAAIVRQYSCACEKVGVVCRLPV